MYITEAVTCELGLIAVHNQVIHIPMLNDPLMELFASSIVC